MNWPINAFTPERRAQNLKKEMVQESPENELPIWVTIPVGESWVIDDYLDRKQYLAAATHGRRTGKKFSQKREGYIMRITRVA